MNQNQKKKISLLVKEALARIYGCEPADMPAGYLSYYQEKWAPRFAHTLFDAAMRQQVVTAAIEQQDEEEVLESTIDFITYVVDDYVNRQISVYLHAASMLEKASTDAEVITLQSSLGNGAVEAEVAGPGLAAALDMYVRKQAEDLVFPDGRGCWRRMSLQGKCLDKTVYDTQAEAEASCLHGQPVFSF